MIKLKHNAILKEATILLVAAVMVISSFSAVANTLNSKLPTPMRDFSPKPSGGQKDDATLLSEGFEEALMPPPGGWYTINNNHARPWTLISASQNEQYVHSGKYAAFISRNSISPMKIDNWLISPDLKVDGYKELFLVFWAMSDTTIRDATVKVHIRGANLDVVIWDLIKNETWPQMEYHKMLFDLRPYVVESKIINISWQYVGFNGQSFALDDIEVYGTTDVTPPITTCTLQGDLQGGVYVSDVTVTLTATDDFSGVNYTMYKIDGGSWTQYTVPFVVSTDGDHTVYFYSVDKAGNIEEEKSQAFTIATDVTPPTTTCTLQGDLQGGVYVSNVTVTLTATDDISGVNYTMCKVDDGTYGVYSAPFIISANGNHTIFFYSVDKAGNIETEQSKTFNITRDVLPPSTLCFLVGTMHNNVYVSNVTVSLIAADNIYGSGVNYTMYKLDDGTWTTYSASFIVSTNGNHTVYFYSVDKAGNIESEKLKAFNITHDVTPPVTTCTLQGDLQGGVYVSDVTVTLTATDDLSGVNHTLYNVDSGSWTTYTVPFVVSTDGTHMVAFYSVDKVGNAELIHLKPFNISHPTPIKIQIVDIKGGLLKVKATVKNNGTTDATNLDWSIKLNGTLIFLGKETTGKVDIAAGKEATLSSSMIIGFGKATITVKVGTASKTANAFVFGIYILIT